MISVLMLSFINGFDFLTLNMFFKIKNILLYFVYVVFPHRIQIMAFQKSGGSVSVSISVSISS